MKAVADELEVVIRPRSGGAPDRTRLRFALPLLPIAALGVARHFQGGLTSGLWYVAGVAALGIVALLARADFFAQTSIRVGTTHVRRTGYLGRSASCPRAAVAHVVEVSAVASRLGGIPANWLLFLDSRAQTILRAYAEYYPADELARLRETLDVGWDVFPNVRTFAQVRRDIPGSFPWSMAHMWLTIALITLGALLIGGLIATNV